MHVYSCSICGFVGNSILMEHHFQQDEEHKGLIIINNVEYLYTEPKQNTCKKPTLGPPPVFQEELNCNHECVACKAPFNRLYANALYFEKKRLMK